jgi:hypothetical protein
MNYYYRDRQGLEIGPLPQSELSQLRQTGLLSDETLVRAEGESGWTEYHTAMAEPESADPATRAQTAATSPSLPKIDRMERARKFSWLLFAFSLLCFLLPFAAVTSFPQQAVISGRLLMTGGEVESINLSNGSHLTKTVVAVPKVALALVLTLAATALALARKPFASLLSVGSGVVGITALITFKSSFEQAIAARGQGAVAMQAGFWIACALLSSGAAVQFAMFREARANAGWRFRARHYAVFACLIFAVGIFYAAPVLYDTSTNTAPSPQALLSSISLQPPSPFAPFKLVTVDCNFTQTGEKASGKAKLTFALNEPLYAADDFAKRAQEKGDDPRAFATALERRNGLPASLAPNVPPDPSRPLYSIAKPAGYQFTVEVDIIANKLPRRWSFDDCVRAWSSRRAWDIQPITIWPALPTEFSGLLTKADLSKRAGIILGEESTEQLLHSYIDGRTAFISAVASAEAAQSKYVLEQTIADAARAEITKDFIPASAYSVKTTTVNLPEVSPSAGAALAVDVEVVIEQTDYLLRPAKEQPAQWMEFQSGSAFEKAKSLAVSISAKALPPKPLNPVVYELVSSPHSTATKLQIEIKGQANAVVVQSATWSDKANFTDNSLVAFKKTGGNALLTLAQTTASDFKTIQDYRQQIQAFILKVGEEHKLQIAQRYENYFVSQQPNDPHFDKYSNQDDPYFTVYGQQFTNGFNSIWNAISIVMTKNGMAPLTADKTFGEISTKFIPYERGLHFASPGVRRFRILLTSSESGVKVEIKTYLYIGWSNAGQNWTREEVEKLFFGRGFDMGSFYMTDPLFRSYDGGLWSTCPDDDESKIQSLKFLDEIATQLKKSP